jgi:arsenite methyltransferase
LAHVALRRQCIAALSRTASLDSARRAPHHGLMNWQPRYGIDAPTVVRNLLIVCLVCVVVTIAVPRIGMLAPLGPLLPSFRGGAIGSGFAAVSMLVSSLWLKHLVRDAMLRSRRWRGDERVLDVGCGRGLFAIGAALRVPQGVVVGLDRWQAVDLSGNDAEAIRANAEAAGVGERVMVETGDARALPFPDASFDVVGSMTVIHNIPGATGRAEAVAEIWRVTRPGGQILIYDIRHARKYARQLRELGAVDLRMSWPILLWGMFGRRFSAVKA